VLAELWPVEPVDLLLPEALEALEALVLLEDLSVQT
jgi:hypothetical protein